MSQAILARLVSTIDNFISGQYQIGDLQAELDASRSALDRSYGELVRELENLEADLEEIRFSRLLDEQRPAAILKIDRVRESLVEALKNLDK